MLSLSGLNKSDKESLLNVFRVEEENQFNTIDSLSESNSKYFTAEYPGLSAQWLILSPQLGQANLRT